MTVENGNQEKRKDLALRQTLETVRGKLMSVMPKTLGDLEPRVEWLMRSFLLCAVDNPTLYECTWMSIMQTVLDTAALGLDFSKTLGQAAPVPYRINGEMTCTLNVMYRGLVGLARRTGDVVMVEARNVYECDTFSIQYGTEPCIRHVPTSECEANEVFKGSYAVVTMPDGTKQFDWMPKADIERIRKRSKAKDKGPWVTDYLEMCKKTVVRRLLKLIPMSPELARALEREDRAESGKHSGELIDVTPEPQPSKADQILDDVHTAAVKLDLQEPATAGDVESRRATAQRILDEQHIREPGEEPEQTEMDTDG